MIKVSLKTIDDRGFELWQEGGVHWAAGTVLDALLSGKYKEIIVTPDVKEENKKIIKESVAK